MNDSVDFDRGWDDYIAGFGDVDGNYWIGLEYMHQLTTARQLSLDIDIELFDGEPFTISAQHFSIGDADSNYKIRISGYRPTDRLGYNVLTPHLHLMMFTTRDRDNDQ